MSGNSTQSLLNFVSGTPVSLYLEQLTDVNVPVGSATDGQVLEWNNASHKWVAGTVSGGGGGATSSSQLSDGASLVKTIDGVAVSSNNNVVLSSSNLTDGSSLVKTINSITPTSNNVVLKVQNLNDVSATSPNTNDLLTYSTTSSTWSNTSISNATGISVSSAQANQGLIYNTTSSKFVNQMIDHTLSLTNVGTNTHAQIDSFIASKDQASGIAGLDSAGHLKVGEIPNLGNSIEYWVDSNYSLGNSDGSILKPFTSITSAMNAVGTGTLGGVNGTRGSYGEPTSTGDPYYSSVFRIFVKSGYYSESPVIPSYRQIILTAIGAVNVSGNVFINIFRNSSNSGTLTYGSFIVMNTDINDISIANTTETYISSWTIGGSICINNITSGSTPANIDLLFDRVVATSLFNTINNLNNTANPINMRMINCVSGSLNTQGTAIINFRINEIINSKITGNFGCYTMGLISNSQLLSGTLTIYNGANFTEPYKFALLNTYYNSLIISNGGSSATTLYVDTNSYIRSGRTLPGTSGNLSLDVFPVSITNPTSNQLLFYNSTDSKWENGTLNIGGYSITINGTPSQGQVLEYDATSNTFQNGSASLAGLSDVYVPSNNGFNQPLFYEHLNINVDGKSIGNGWIPKAITTSDVYTDNTQATTLSTVLGGKADLVNNVLKTSEIPTSVCLSVNSITTSNNNVVVPISSCSDVSITSVSSNQGLIYNSTSSKWINQQIDHTTLSNIGTNTHAQIDTFIASKGQASGLADLDSGTNLPLSRLGNCTNNTICFYVDSKYTGSVNDGSILKPYTTISSALALISPWSSSSDPHIADRYVIHVAGGAYDESLTIPNFSHITLVADGLVFLGATTLQYFEGMSSAGHVRDITLNVGKPSSFTGTSMMRATCVMTTTSYLQRGQAFTHTGLEGGWKVSGIFNICVLSGATSSDVELELIDFRSCDFSDTGVSGSRASTGYFINNTSTYSGSWGSAFDVKLTGCRGNGINFAYGGNYNNFNLIDMNNCYFINMVNVGKLGLIQHCWFYGSSGVSFQTLSANTYQLLASSMIDTTCLSGCTFTCGTSGTTLYVDNATWIKSGKAIAVGGNGNLTLQVDYGNFAMPNISTTGATTGQALLYNSSNSTWSNGTVSSGSSTLSGCTDVNVSEGSGIDQYLLYWDNSTSKWKAKTLTSSDIPSLAESKITNLTTDLGNKVSSINSINPTSGAITLNLSNIADTNISGLSSGNILAYNGTNWINNVPTFVSSVNGVNPSSGALTLTLEQLNDVAISAPTDGQVISWNNSTSKWNASNASAGSTLSSLTDVSIPTSSNYLILATSGGIYQSATVASPSWSVLTPTSSYSTNALQFLAYANNIYIMCDINGAGNTFNIYSSNNLTSWTNTATILYSSGLYCQYFYFDGTNYIIYGLNGTNSGNHNQFAYSTNLTSWSYGTVSTVNTDVSSLVSNSNNTMYLACQSGGSNPNWFKSSSLTGTWTALSSGQNGYGEACSNGSNFLWGCQTVGVFYSTDNLNTITQINTSGTGFTGGCQSVAYVSFLNAYIICDMGSSTQHGFISSTLQPNLTSWTQFNFSYAVQYIYGPDDFIPMRITSGTNYIIRSHNQGSVAEYSTNGTSWTPLTLPSGTFYFDTVTSLSLSSFVSGDLLNWNGSKWTPTGVLNLPTSTNSSPSNGQIWYDNSSNTFKFYQNGSTSTLSGSSIALSSLSDCSFTEGSGINGYYLSWNNSSSKWVAVAPSTSSLSGLNDVSLTEGSGIDGQVLYWKNSDNKWETKAMSLANLGGVSLGILTANQVLQCVSGNFQNQVLNLTQLGDILVSSPAGGQMLVYNDGSTNKWQNVSKLTLPSFTNSSAVNGDVWYDNSSSQFKFYQNGSTITIPTSVGSSTLSGLSDVSVSEGSGINNYVLYWNNSNSKWQSELLNLESLNNVGGAQKSSGELLYYNGSIWTNTAYQITPATSNVGTNDVLGNTGNNVWSNKTPQLNWNSDLVLSSMINCDTLIYNNSTSKWNNLSAMSGSTPVYNKFQVPIMGFYDSTDSTVVQSAINYNVILGCLGYAIQADGKQYYCCCSFSMPFDYLEGSSFYIAVRLTLETSTNNTVGFSCSATFQNGGSSNLVSSSTTSFGGGKYLKLIMPFTSASGITCDSLINLNIFKNTNGSINQIIWLQNVEISYQVNTFGSTNYSTKA